MFFYGLHGRIARVSLPRFVPHPRSIPSGRIQLTKDQEAFEAVSQEVYDVGAVAQKNLDDRYESLVLRAAARAALKLAAVEGISYGTRAAVNDSKHQWVGLVVTLLARMVALATEEADIRSWRLLPGKIHMARLWLPAGTYGVFIDPPDHDNSSESVPPEMTLTLQKGDVRFVIQYHGTF